LQNITISHKHGHHPLKQKNLTKQKKFIAFQVLSTVLMFNA